MKVLLVDDSVTMRRIQKTQLNALGVSDIIEAADGNEALKMLDRNMPVDLVLLDWNMPVMDGMGFLKRVRSIEAYRSVKVVMCTSETEKGRVVEALKVGANNYIVKPFTADTLKEKLDL